MYKLNVATHEVHPIMHQHTSFLANTNPLFTFVSIRRAHLCQRTERIWAEAPFTKELVTVTMVPRVATSARKRESIADFGILFCLAAGPALCLATLTTKTPTFGFQSSQVRGKKLPPGAAPGPHFLCNPARTGLHSTLLQCNVPMSQAPHSIPTARSATSSLGDSTHTMPLHQARHWSCAVALAEKSSVAPSSGSKVLVTYFYPSSQTRTSRPNIVPNDIATCLHKYVECSTFAICRSRPAA